MDLIAGTRDMGIVIYFQNADGTLDLFKKIDVSFKEVNGMVTTYPNHKDRNSPELCDLNGDGLLDIIIGHQSNTPKINNTTFRRRRVEILYNRGTRTIPLFDPDKFELLSIDGEEVRFKFCNFLFVDLDGNRKKDLLFFKGDSTNEASFHYSLNVSNDDSIILGAVQDVKFNGNSLIAKKLHGKENGHKLSISYCDTDNNGINEFYFNTRDGYFRYTLDNPVDVIIDVKLNEGIKCNVKYLGNKIILNNSIENAKISIVDVKGRVVDTRIITMEGEKVIALKKLSAGSYFLRLKNDDIIQTLKFVKME